jgi:uncharacterized protein YebE (UPF0316 family)
VLKRGIFSGEQIKKDEKTGHVAHMESSELHGKFWSENLERRNLVRRTHRWEDNIKMDLREIGYEVVDWIQLIQDRKM